MWFLARKEIRHARGRFALFTALVGLIALLVFVLTGLANGLGEATVSGVRDLTDDAALVAFAPGSQRSLSRSELDAGLADTVAAVPGVTGVEAVGQSMAGVTTADGTTHAVALVGRGTGTGAVADPATGLQVGDVVAIQPGGVPVTITAVEPSGSIQHAPVLTVPLETWQQARYGTAAGTTPPDRASALLVQTAPGAEDQVAAALGSATGTAAGTAGSLDVATTADAVAATPGYAEETGTIGLIRGFLLAIAALLVGTIFWVLTVQKAGPLAVLRATGARRGLLLRTYLLQVVLIVGAGVAGGLALAAVFTRAMPAAVFALTATDALAAAALLGVLALGASATSMRRLLTVDPLTSLGRL